MHNIFDISSQIYKTNYINKNLCKLNPNKSTRIEGIKSKFSKEGANVIISAIKHLNKYQLKIRHCQMNLITI